MITSLLQGGLGNQMFQIAAAWSHSKTIGSNCEFDLKPAPWKLKTSIFI